MIPVVYCRHFKQLRKLLCTCNFCLRNKLDISKSSSYCTKQQNTEPPDALTKTASDLPEEPTTCCMSGCANCVWLDYTDKLSAYMSDNGEKAIQIIEEKISDSNVKAFLLHELRTRQKSN